MGTDREGVRSEEAQAIAILWEKGGGKGDPPEHDWRRLLANVREREEQIEAETQTMLMNAIREGRRTPRRHMLFVFAILAGLLLLAGLIGYIFDR